MWKCPKCDKENKGNFCVLCGEPKPGVNTIQSDNNQQANQYSGVTNNVNHNNVNQNDNAMHIPRKAERKNNTGLIVLCIILSVLLVVVLAVVGLVMWMNFTTTDNNDDIIVYETEAPADDEEEPGEIVIELDPYSSSSYIAFTDFNYNFVCPYPANFHEISSDGINALKTFESPDGTAKMTIRACENTSGIDIETAMNDFYNAYGGYVTYDATGETWYASSIDLGDRLLYRKCFITNGNIYCFDFEFIEYDVDYYSPYIEYIENNFKVL